MRLAGATRVSIVAVRCLNTLLYFIPAIFHIVAFSRLLPQPREHKTRIREHDNPAA